MNWWQRCNTCQPMLLSTRWWSSRQASSMHRVAGVVQTVDVLVLDEFARVAEVWLVAAGDGSPHPLLLGVVCHCGARMTHQN